MRILGAALAALALVLTGCASSRFTTDVTPFHELDPNKLSLSTYAFSPSPGQQDSLEFRTYAKLVGDQLQAYGMSEVAQEKAAYLISMDYGIDNGKVVTYSYPIYGQTGVSGASTSGYRVGNSYSSTTTFTPTFGVVGAGTDSTTVYTRFLEVRIFDRSDSPDRRPKVIYEAKANSKGSSSQLSTVMPYMIRSIFADFPGQSGKSRQVTLTQSKD